MLKYNLIFVFNKDFDKLLMCKRKKDPYKGLINLIGGKKEDNEKSIDGAYRELKEETGINKNQIKLEHIMDFNYYYAKTMVEVYVGKLNEDIKVYGEENPLFWETLDKDFFDMNIYAGEGNIGHIMEHIKMIYNK